MLTCSIRRRARFGDDSEVHASLDVRVRLFPTRRSGGAMMAPVVTEPTPEEPAFGASALVKISRLFGNIIGKLIIDLLDDFFGELVGSSGKDFGDSIDEFLGDGFGDVLSDIIGENFGDSIDDFLDELIVGVFGDPVDDFPGKLVVN